MVIDEEVAIVVLPVLVCGNMIIVTSDAARRVTILSLDCNAAKVDWTFCHADGLMEVSRKPHSDYQACSEEAAMTEQEERPVLTSSCPCSSSCFDSKPLAHLPSQSVYEQLPQPP